MSMKKILQILAITLPLVGCSDLKDLAGTTIFPPRFDPLEYNRVVEVRKQAILGISACEDPKTAAIMATNLNNETVGLGLYSQYIPRNGDIVKMERNLQQITGEFAKRYQAGASVSKFYCEQKLEIIARTSETIQSVIGAKE